MANGFGQQFFQAASQALPKGAALGIQAAQFRMQRVDKDLDRFLAERKEFKGPFSRQEFTNKRIAQAKEAGDTALVQHLEPFSKFSDLELEGLSKLKKNINEERRMTVPGQVNETGLAHVNDLLDRYESRGIDLVNFPEQAKSLLAQSKQFGKANPRLQAMVGEVTKQQITQSHLTTISNQTASIAKSIPIANKMENAEAKKTTTDNIKTNIQNTRNYLNSVSREISKEAFNSANDQLNKQEALLTGEAVKPTTAGGTTDIAAFAADAETQVIAQAKKENRTLTPAELAKVRNDARLQFKRAQKEEVKANRLAEKEVDESKAQSIAFKTATGTQLALIANAPALAAAKGEVTPAGKIGIAKKRMTGNLAKLAKHYMDLDSMGSIINVDKSTMSNVFAALKVSAVGQSYGRITGSEAQSVRSSIKKLKPLLIQDIRQSTNMGARGLDSEKELEFYLQAATDEKTDLQSNIAAIVVLDEAFGDGQVAQQLKRHTNNSLIKRISDEGQFILGGGKEGAIGTQVQGTPTTVRQPTQQDAPLSAAEIVEVKRMKAEGKSSDEIKKTIRQSRIK